MSTPIPQPPTIPFLGNYQIDSAAVMASLDVLSAKYGEIFKITVLGKDRYFIGSVALLNELCDEKKFCKAVPPSLIEVRNGLKDGLFTAHPGEHNWGVAHRILTPAFGPLAIKDMFDEMYDIATQLVSKWARMGPESPIQAAEDFTRLAFDSIALCAMDKRFNSFYSEDMPQFVKSMTNFLIENGKRVYRTRLESLVLRETERQYWADIKYMRNVAQEVVDYRRANPSDKKDLLNALIHGKDPLTGEHMTDDSIINNMITFLIAGHETTSSLLAFSFYFMLKNPEALHLVQKEVDQVIGSGPIKFEQMSKLPYIEAVLREALRLQPPAPAISFRQKTPENGPFILGGKYTLPANAEIIGLVRVIGRDPVVYGTDALEFKVDRMHKENFHNLPPNAWKPFGNGARACIGRPFAWQEAILAVAMIMQNFNVRMDDPSYELQVKETLTTKPASFRMKASLREGINAMGLEKRLFAGPQSTTERTLVTHEGPTAASASPMTILWGGNSGTCEGLAQTLASGAAAHGFKATVRDMNSAVEKLPRDQPVVIVTASYEGQPADNAAAFVQWLKIIDSNKTAGTRFAVFGCGHQDWANTYQRVPRLVESLLLSKDAISIVERGETNVASGKIFDDFDSWIDKLWSALSKNDAQKDIIEGLDVDISTGTRASHLRHSVQDALVLKNVLLTRPGVPQKRHMDIKLPSGTTYQSGDYLAVLPINNIPTIARVLKRFHLPWDAMMKLKKGSHTTIPTDVEMPLAAVLGAYVELNGSATRKNLGVLAQFGCDEVKLSELSSKSVLEILEAFPGIELPFGLYLAMLPPMRIRQYSISSSPLNDSTVVSITFSVLENEGFLGVTTNYLRDVKPGATIQVAVRRSHASFHLPHDDGIPIIMAGAGTGLAPFHGFVQERAAKIAAGKKLAEAALFIGCRSPEEDMIYAEELAEWEKEGAVKVYYAFSRASERSEHCKYTQDRMWHERAEISRLFKAGAQAYVCGSAKLGKGIGDVAARIAVEDAKSKGQEKTYEECLEWWEGLRNERYAVDVFD